MNGVSETGGQLRVIKVIMYNKVLASAVTMQENTHWDQAGAWSKAPPGRLRNLSYISQNNGCSFIVIEETEKRQQISIELFYLYF